MKFQESTSAEMKFTEALDRYNPQETDRKRRWFSETIKTKRCTHGLIEKHGRKHGEIVGCAISCGIHKIISNFRPLIDIIHKSQITVQDSEDSVLEHTFESPQPLDLGSNQFVRTSAYPTLETIEKIERLSGKIGLSLSELYQLSIAAALIDNTLVRASDNNHFSELLEIFSHWLIIRAAQAEKLALDAEKVDKTALSSFRRKSLDDVLKKTGIKK